MAEFVSKMGLRIQFTPVYSPWSNGNNETNHYSANVIIKKVMDEEKTITLEDAMSMAAWAHNTNANKSSYAPLTLAIGKSVMF